jgi:hypothetical protein
MASGFPVGIGSAGCTCGALNDGMRALGIKYGSTEPGSNNTEILKLSHELHDWLKNLLQYLQPKPDQECWIR